jgi:predicted Zn-dependent peptidase
MFHSLVLSPPDLGGEGGHCLAGFYRFNGLAGGVNIGRDEGMISYTLRGSAKRPIGFIAIAVAVLLVGPITAGAQQSPTRSGAPGFRIPLAQRTLKNGLTVVVSEDHSAPIFGICVDYSIGFRLEPQGRTGFAHLFEHLMFEGTPVTKKGILDRVVESSGGSFSADTRYDRTQYVATAPVSALDRLMWLEADRMKTIDFSDKNLENQRSVVKEEVRVNVLNQPYGIFYILDLPQKAFDTFANNHNFYGDFHDLDAATLDDVKAFYGKYYAPNNAVLAIVGDVTPEEVFAKAEKYFEAIPKRDVPPRPNFNEPAQTAERRATEVDALAKMPAFAIGFRMPDHGTHEAIVGAVVGEMLHNGQASMLYQQLVKEKKVAVSVSGGLNWPLGNPFEYKGPSLMTTFIVSQPGTSEADVLRAFDDVVGHLSSQGPTEAEIQRAVKKMRSDLIDQLERPIERASILAEATLFDGNANLVNRMFRELSEVTPAQVQEFARKYLVASNRTVIERGPAPPGDTKTEKNTEKQTGGAQ